MGSRVAAALPLLAGCALAGLLLGLAPDPYALEAQALGRILRGDGSGTLLTALSERLGAPHFELRISREGGDEALQERVAYRRAFEAALNVENARRAERGAPPLEVSPGASAPLLELELARSGGRLGLEARLRGPDGVQALPTPPPARVPDRRALIPPLVAILIALGLRRTIAALVAGIWIGAALLRLTDGSGWAAAIPLGFFDVVAHYLRDELVDTFRIEIIGFVVALMALIGVVSRGGGLHGLVETMARFAGSVRSTLLVSFGMGCSVFFDDYTNCLIVGNTMRPLADRLRISREKLAYVVDSTAAPVAGLSLLSTWVAFEVSTFSAQLPAAGIAENPYAIFLQTLPFRFYCLFTLAFVVLNAWLGRDFGPMWRAEARARTTGQLVRPGGQALVSAELTELEPSAHVPKRSRNAVVPLVAVVVVTLQEIFRRGGGYALLRDAPERLASLQGWTDVLSLGGVAGPLFTAATVGLLLAVWLLGSNATRVAVALGVAACALGAPSLTAALQPLLLDFADWAAIGLGFAAGAVPAWLLAARVSPPTRRHHLPISELGGSALAGVRGLSFAVMILLCAWMIGQVCEDIGTADYLVGLASGVVTAVWLPVLMFAIACLVSFSTGTSWGTMAILIPNVVGLAAAIGAEHEIGSLGLVVICIGAVLEGSIFGDHCSPISDTTILSSLSTASDHIDHVRTQAPYALLTAAAAVAFGYLPTLLFDFWSFPLAMLAGVGALFLVLRLLGRPAPVA